MEVKPRLYRVVGELYGVNRTWKTFQSLHKAKTWIEQQKSLCTPCAKTSFKDIRIEIVDKASGIICETFYL